MNTKSRWAPNKPREFKNLWTPISNCGRLYFLRRFFPFAPHARPVSGNASACELPYLKPIRSSRAAALPRTAPTATARNRERQHQSQAAIIPGQLQVWVCLRGSAPPARCYTARLGACYSPGRRYVRWRVVGWSCPWKRAPSVSPTAMLTGDRGLSGAKKHRLGTFVWADGSRHHDYYRAGIKSGVGTLHYASGAVFE